MLVKVATKEIFSRADPPDLSGKAQDQTCHGEDVYFCEK